jgi:hypothetical protein
MQGRLIAALAALAVMLLAAGSGHAASPSAGTVGPTAPSVSWQGQSYANAATLDPTLCPPASVDTSNTVCDHFALTVDVAPSYWSTATGGADVTISWGSSDNDFDLYIYDSAGNQVTSSAQGGTTSEQAFIPNASGTYDVVVVPYTVTNSSYTGNASFVTGAAPAGGDGGTAQRGFTAPLKLPGSDGFGEPSIVSGSGRLVVTAPNGLLTTATADQPSPLWISTNGGTSFQGPIYPLDAGVFGEPLGGGDTDVVQDPFGNIFQTDLWLGDTTTRVSTDGGQTWLSDVFSHTSPGDDRPWLAYSGPSNSLFMVYDGLDAVHVARSSLAAGPQGGIAFVQDVPAVPECLIGGQSLVDTGDVSLANPCYSTGASVNIRQCVCPPGGIAVDQNTGTVYITYSRQNGAAVGGGVGVARSDDQGLTWTQTSIPGTGSTGSAFDTEYNFQPVKVDSLGNVYVTWGEVQKNGSVAIRFSASQNHGATWSKPVTVSTTTASNVFPTLDLVAPGKVDIAYYGTKSAGDPNAVTKATWGLYLAKSTNALAKAPSFAAKLAVSGIHTGTIESSNGTSDRSLLDFFQVAVDPLGKANIIYTAGDENIGTDLFFTKEK